MEEKFYYNDSENVSAYIQMSAPYNGQLLLEQLSLYLPVNATVLELGMGPGKDLNLLKKKYLATGSDLSSEFIRRYKQQNPGSDLHVLDARTIEIDRTFDCIFSNKVLHHLSGKQLTESLHRQHQLLNPGGILLHSFWEGEREEVLSGLRFVYYRLKHLTSVFPPLFLILKSDIYSEVFPDDSIYILAQKQG